MTETALKTLIVTDSGFSRDDWTGPAHRSATLAPEDLTADLTSDLAARLPDLDLIRVPFASFADGRGFTLARALRRKGYRGRLRAVGHVLADQYAMVRRAGFDEVEIDAALAARQPQAQWRARADWQAHDYQARLRGARTAPTP
ncbi:MAG: DUF934 domain-containing protein [Pseudodonghicola sp.]|nr:DUF934 domain-containing protein [Pseudodonghicola sp.]